MTKTEKLKKQIVKRSWAGLNRTSTVCELIDLYKDKSTSPSYREYFVALVHTSRTKFVCFVGAIGKKKILEKVCIDLGFTVTSEKIDYVQYKEYKKSNVTVL